MDEELRPTRNVACRLGCGWEHHCTECETTHVCGTPCDSPDPRDAMLASLRQELHHMNRAITDYLTERDRLRQAIRHWPMLKHKEGCDPVLGSEGWCLCGAFDANEARARARQQVGIEEEEEP